MTRRIGGRIMGKAGRKRPAFFYVVVATIALALAGNLFYTRNNLRIILEPVMQEGCHAKARDPDQGYVRTCPLAHSCARFAAHNLKKKPSGYSEMPVAPYDFDDEECGYYVPNE